MSNVIPLPPLTTEQRRSRLYATLPLQFAQWIESYSTAYHRRHPEADDPVMEILGDERGECCGIVRRDILERYVQGRIAAATERDG